MPKAAGPVAWRNDGGYGQPGGMKRFFPSKYNRGFSLGGGAGGSMGGMGGMGGAEGGYGGMMGGGGMEGGMGRRNGAALQAWDGIGGATGGTTGGLGGAVRPKQKKIKAELMIFNAVTALVPRRSHQGIRR